MKILFYDAKKYDKESFDKVAGEYKNIEIEYRYFGGNCKICKRV